ncbi:hypothetical protein G6F31_016754 [Rhizopus arrhizus]|nr:hypothetical protein G6F31_016754 [Rhizopus arrhizus]
MVGSGALHAQPRVRQGRCQVHLGVAGHPVQHIADLPHAGFAAYPRHAGAAAIHHGEQHAGVPCGKCAGPGRAQFRIVLVAAECGQRVLAGHAPHAIGIGGAAL